MIPRCAILAIAMACAAGCADLARPRWLHPGPEGYQQRRAERFDPYPMTDVAPEVVGGRPLQYIRPAPENERAQNEQSFEERYHQAPPPGLYRPPRGQARPGITYVPALPSLQEAPPFNP